VTGFRAPSRLSASPESLVPPEDAPRGVLQGPRTQGPGGDVGTAALVVAELLDASGCEEKGAGVSFEPGSPVRDFQTPLVNQGASAQFRSPGSHSSATASAVAHTTAELWDRLPPVVSQQPSVADAGLANPRRVSGKFEAVDSAQELAVGSSRSSAPRRGEAVDSAQELACNSLDKRLCSWSPLRRC
jgi:hypothetical protein